MRLSLADAQSQNVTGASWWFRSSFCAALMLASAVVALPPSAQAFELFGYHLFGDKDKPETHVANPLAYEAKLEVGQANDDLQSLLNENSLLVTEQDKAPSGETGLISRALNDTERLIASLYTKGYYGGTVAVTLNGTDLQKALGNGSIPGSRPVQVNIAVDPGPQFHFGTVRLQGSDVTANELKMRTGAVAGSSEILTAEKKLVADLRTQGYAKARIANREVTADHTNRTLDVSLRVTPGKKAVFGPVSVSGTEVTEPDFIVQQALIPVGTVYDPKVIEAARKRLSELGIFSSIRILEGDIDPHTGQMPLTIEVSERKRHVIGGGVSWSSNEGISTEAYWKRRNLFGRGELLHIQGSVGRIGAGAFENMEYSARIAFEKPGAFGPYTKFTTSLSARQERPKTYRERTITLEAHLTHEFSKKLNGRIGAELSYINIKSDSYTKNYLLAGIPLALTYDSRDSKLDPTKGVFASAEFEPAYDIAGKHPMLFMKGTLSSYAALDDAGRFVLAGRIGAGSILAHSLDDVPLSRRMLVGGGGSIRGYAHRNVGPRKNGEVVGGRSYVEVSAELRAKLTETIGVVGFVDAGNAYKSIVPDFSTPLKYSVGAGLRYYTALGPLRVDVAVPLNREKDDPKFGVYVGLSQAF